MIRACAACAPLTVHGWALQRLERVVSFPTLTVTSVSCDPKGSRKHFSRKFQAPPHCITPLGYAGRPSKCGSPPLGARSAGWWWCCCALAVPRPLPPSVPCVTRGKGGFRGMEEEVARGMPKRGFQTAAARKAQSESMFHLVRKKRARLPRWDCYYTLES